MTTLRDWAELYLDDLRLSLQRDPVVYDEYGAKAFETIDDYIDVLRTRVRNTQSCPNHAYDRQGDLAASMIVLAMEYPECYTALMQHVVGSSSVRLLDGVSRLDIVLNGLSDDHGYVLIKDAAGLHRLYLESNLPKEYGFVPLTGSRDLCEVTCALLAERGFEADQVSAPQRSP